MVEFSFTGKKIYQRFHKEVASLKRQFLRQIGAAMRPKLREAVSYGRSLLKQLFFSRGKRFQRAFTQQIRVRGDDIDARLGYIRSDAKTRRWWWLGRLYERGISIESKKHKGVWVPIGSNRQADGRPVVSAKQYYEMFRGHGVVKMSQRGNLIAFGDGQPMFVIKKSVKLKPRQAVGPTVEKYLPQIEEAAAIKLFHNFRQ